MKRSLQTIQQQRAKHALSKIQEWKKESSEVQKNLESYSRDLPAMVLMNGLGQAVAFAKMKGESFKEYSMLYQALRDWLRECQPDLEQPELIEIITNVDMYRYQQLQAELLMYLDWIKKFSKAFLDKEDI